MGMMSTEQTVQIINAVGETIEASKDPQPSYWWLLLIAVVPVVVGAYLKRKVK